MKINRRQALGAGAAALNAVVGNTTLVQGAPYVFSRKRRKLRVLGTHVTLQETIRRQAEKDLGIELLFQPGGSAEVLHKASTRPQEFDLYEQWSNSIRVLWQSKAIQPIDTQPHTLLGRNQRSVQERQADSSGKFGGRRCADSPVVCAE